jgi:predicted anti-sigma-YlaC factor YlaD
VQQRRFYHLLRHLALTQEEEISCTECFDLLPQYVDGEVAGETPDERSPRLKQHLDQCDVCREEYEILRDLVRHQAENRLPSVDELRQSF